MLLLRTLGELRLEGDDNAALSSRRKELLLLAYLARRASRTASRAELAGLLWHDRDDTRARQSLRQAVVELKRLLGDGMMFQADRIVLAENALILDAAAFEDDLTSGRLAEAVERWSGDFLAGAEEVGGEQFRSWLEAEREGLRRRLQSTLRRLVEDARQRGAWSQGIVWAQRWVEMLPFDPEGFFQVIELLHLDGRNDEALARHAVFLTRLRTELEVEPSADFVRLGTRLERSAGAAPSVATPGSSALFTPDLVQRGPALADLLAAWQRVRAGGMGVVLVEGEAGIGKTRLCDAFVRDLEDDPSVLVLRVLGQGSDQNVELAAVRALVTGLSRSPGLGGASASALSELAFISPAIADRFPTLPQPVGGQSPQVEALREALLSVAAETPVVMYIDDFHLVDTQSQGFIARLISRVDSGVLVLLTARTGDEAWSSTLSRVTLHPGLRRLKLRTLDAKGVEALLGSMLQLPASDRHLLAKRLHDHGGGNPFYVIELTAALVDEGLLLPTETGSWRLASRDSNTLPLPATIREVIGRRLARLSSEARLTAEGAAVLGRTFDPQLVPAAAGLTPATCAVAMEELIARKLVREAPQSPGMCEFTHDLICRVAYELLPAPRRETLHQRAARAWEGKARRNPAAQTALAYHRGRAGLSERAPWWKRRAVVAGAVAALVAVLAGTVWLLRPRPSIPVIASRVAVFPFPVQGAGAYNFLGEGMVDLLSSKLDGAGELKRVDPAKVFAAAGKNGVAVDNLERASETAARIGAGLFVTGRVLQLGSRLHIEASLYDRRTPDLAEFHTSVEDDASRAPELVDQLAVQLLAARGTPRAADARRVALSTTKSLPALRAYLEGEQLLRGRQFEPATKAFQRAVAADSLFALAYYRLAVAAMWDDDTELEHDAIETAVRLGTRLPDPVRLFARGLMAWWKGDVSEAEQLFRSSLSLDPEQAEAWYFLGETQLHLGLMNGEPLSDSREAFEMTVSLDSSNAEARWHLIQLAAMDERFADVESLLNRAHPDGNRDKYWDAVTAFGRGTDVDRTRAIETLSRSSLDDAWLAVLMVNMFFDDFDAMEPLVQVLLVPSRPAEVRANGYVWLAHMDLARGRWRSAKGRLEQAARHDPATAIEMQAYLMGLPFVSASEEELRSTLQRLRVWDAQRVPKSLPHPWFSLHDGLHPSLRLYYLGTLGARLGQVGYVVRSVNALEAADTSPSRESLRSNLARTLRAMLAERRGGPAAALAVVKTPRKLLNTELVTFSPFYSQADERYLRAEWLHQTGARDEALRWYTSLAESPPYGFVFRGPSYMRRAEIYEARGDSALAVEYYGRFVKMWKDCDPELRPMVAKAEQKLLALSR